MVSNVAVTREVTAAHRLFILVRAQGSLPILHVGGNVMFTDGETWAASDRSGAPSSLRK